MKVIAVLCALLVHHACTGSYAFSDRYQDSPVARASNEFTMKLLRDQLKNSGSGSGNVLVSGLSAHAALSLLHQGAGGRTAQELARLLRLNTHDNRNILEAYQSDMNDMQQDKNLNFVNKLFPSKRFQINRDFINKADQYFNADVQKLDYSNPSQAAQEINKYVEKETNNKIQNLVSPQNLDSNTALMIINAIHFKASWKSPFGGSHQQEFHVSPSQKVRAEMMTQTGQFEYKEDNGLGVKILKMDYDNNAQGYSMYFILPKHQNGHLELESTLGNVNPDNLLKGLHSTNVQVTIPKFKFGKSNDLKETLKRMGGSEMFSSSADFHNIADGIRVSNVIQKAIISVDENGTEAAAATSVGVQLHSMPSVHFRADHPFFFAIVRNQKILFAGKLANPTSYQSRAY